MGSPVVDVREHGLIFTAESVRAIMAGTKLQTRRVVTDRNSLGNWKASELDLSRGWVDRGPSPAGNAGPYLKSYVGRAALEARGHAPNEEIVDRLYPRYAVGDSLWVRESHAVLDMRPDIVLHDQPWPPSAGTCWPASVTYRADEATLFWDDLPAEAWRESFDNDHRTWRPSIHMPRWASRLTLELTDVRVERVQDISDADCIAEGAMEIPDAAKQDVARVCAAAGRSECGARDYFARLWDFINLPRGYGWDANPWVWCLTFGVRSQTPETTP